jgi:DsbC/DsbD-like thiol-disulfide interchange protein
MKTLLALLTIPLLTTASDRAGDPPKNPVRWTIVGGNATRVVASGTTIQVILEADIAKGWHIYSLTQKPGGPIPLRIQLAGAADVGVRGGIKGPTPVKKFDQNFRLETELYRGKPRFTIPIGVPAGSLAGKREVQVSARYQACSDTLCLPPRTERLPVTLRIKGAE